MTYSDKELWYLQNQYPNVALALQDVQASEADQLTVLRAVDSAAPNMPDYYGLKEVAGQLPHIPELARLANLQEEVEDAQD